MGDSGVWWAPLEMGRAGDLRVALGLRARRSWLAVLCGIRALVGVRDVRRRAIELRAEDRRTRSSACFPHPPRSGWRWAMIRRILVAVIAMTLAQVFVARLEAPTRDAGRLRAPRPILPGKRVERLSLDAEQADWLRARLRSGASVGPTICMTYGR